MLKKIECMVDDYNIDDFKNSMKRIKDSKGESCERQFDIELHRYNCLNISIDIIGMIETLSEHLSILEFCMLIDKTYATVEDTERAAIFFCNEVSQIRTDEILDALKEEV